MKTATQAQRGAYATSNTRLIARLRRAKGLTQPQAAAFVRVPLRTYQRAEAGDYVTRATLRAIERALGLAW